VFATVKIKVTAQCPACKKKTDVADVRIPPDYVLIGLMSCLECGNVFKPIGGYESVEVDQ
jgi:hypothetical protein